MTATSATNVSKDTQWWLVLAWHSCDKESYFYYCFLLLRLLLAEKQQCTLGFNLIHGIKIDILKLPMCKTQEYHPLC